MAFEPVFEMAAFDNYRLITSGQAVVEARMMPKPGNTIAKVLSTSGDVSISASEAFTGEARYSGKVNFKVLFSDAEGNLCPLDYNAEFSDKLTDPSITSATKSCFKAKILDMDVVSVAPDEIKLAAVVEVSLYGAEHENMKYLSRGGEGVYTHEDRMDCMKKVAQGEDNFILADTVSDVKATKVLLAEACVSVYKRSAGKDIVTVEGEAFCQLTCLGEDGMIICYNQNVPFLQEISAPGSGDNDVAMAEIVIKSLNVNFIEGETKAVETEFNLMASVSVWREEVYTPVVDAFCVKHELMPVMESAPICVPKGEFSVRDSVDGSVTIDDSNPLADNILAVTGKNLNISSAVAGEGRTTLEGIVTCNIIYYSAEHNSKNSIAAEIPFSITVMSDVDEGDILSACGQVTKVNVKIRRGNQLDIRAEFCAVVTRLKKDTKMLIADMKLGEQRPVSEAGLSVHIARKNETLWDVAKAFGITPEEVALQNPGMTLPLSGGERLIAYRQLMKD